MSGIIFTLIFWAVIIVGGLWIFKLVYEKFLRNRFGLTAAPPRNDTKPESLQQLPPDTALKYKTITTTTFEPVITEKTGVIQPQNGSGGSPKPKRKGFIERLIDKAAGNPYVPDKLKTKSRNLLDEIYRGK